MPDPFAAGVPALATPRLALRPLTSADDPAVLGLLSDARSVAGWGMAPFRSLDEARAYRRVREDAAAARSGFTWGVWDAGGLVGLVVLVRWAPNHRRVELGYLLGSAAWGRGLATEAARAALAFAFGPMDVWRVEAETTPDNEPSMAVMRRLGFRFEARLAQRIGDRDVPDDSMLFRLLRPEFEAGCTAGA